MKPRQSGHEPIEWASYGARGRRLAITSVVTHRNSWLWLTRLSTHAGRLSSVCHRPRSPRSRATGSPGRLKSFRAVYPLRRDQCRLAIATARRGAEISFRRMCVLPPYLMIGALTGRFLRQSVAGVSFPQEGHQIHDLLPGELVAKRGHLVLPVGDEIDQLRVSMPMGVSAGSKRGTNPSL